MFISLHNLNSAHLSNFIFSVALYTANLSQPNLPIHSSLNIAFISMSMTFLKHFQQYSVCVSNLKSNSTYSMKSFVTLWIYAVFSDGVTCRQLIKIINKMKMRLLAYQHGSSWEGHQLSVRVFICKHFSGVVYLTL